MVGNATVARLTTWWVAAAMAWRVLGAAEASEPTVPAGFRLEIIAEQLGGARALAIDPRGTPVVSVSSRGRVVALPARDGGGARTTVTILSDLDRPHGLAFRRGALYVAETGRIVRYRYDPATWTATEPQTIVDGLPHAGHHWTRAIAFGPDDKLYVAIGSSCDICRERDRRRAAIVRYNADGSDERLLATGLRNPVGLAFHPTTRALWTTVNERDWPDGTAPPDFVTEVRAGAAYGWPGCYAERRAFFRDPTFVEATDCRTMTLPTLELTPHAAPLGMAFYTGRQFPAEYAGDLFIALHGSRAGLPAAGYGILRVRFRAGWLTGVEPFGSAWRRGDHVLGRPVDLAVGGDGSLYVSDDHADRVYRVSYPARAPQPPR